MLLVQTCSTFKEPHLADFVMMGRYKNKKLTWKKWVLIAFKAIALAINIFLLGDDAALFCLHETSHCGGLQTPKSMEVSWFTALKTSRTSAAWPRQKFAATSMPRPMTSCPSQPGGAGLGQRKWNRKSVSFSQVAPLLRREGFRGRGVREVTNHKPHAC